MNLTRVAELLQLHEFPVLFIEELGWDTLDLQFKVYLAPKGEGERNAKKQPEPEAIGTKFITFTLTGIAHKRGAAILQCVCDGETKFPDVALRRRIDLQVGRRILEHCLIFIDEGTSAQTWLWTARERSGTAKYREHVLQAEEDAQPFARTLHSLAFTAQQEEHLSLVSVVRQLRAAFDVTPLKNKQDDTRSQALQQSVDFAQWFAEQHTDFSHRLKKQRFPNFYVKAWECDCCWRRFHISAKETTLLFGEEEDAALSMLHCPWCRESSFLTGFDGVLVEDEIEEVLPYYWREQYRHYAVIEDSPFGSPHSSVLAVKEREWEYNDYRCHRCAALIEVQEGFCYHCAAFANLGQITNNAEAGTMLRVWQCESCTRFYFTPRSEPEIHIYAYHFENNGLFCPWCQEETKHHTPGNFPEWLKFRAYGARE